MFHRYQVRRVICSYDADIFWPPLPNSTLIPHKMLPPQVRYLRDYERYKQRNRTLQVGFTRLKATLSPRPTRSLSHPHSREVFS